VRRPPREQRVFIEDGDRVVLRGWAAAPRRPRIGFGEASGTVLPARRPRAASPGWQAGVATVRRLQ